MASYVILSRFSPRAFADPKEFRQLGQTMSEKIKKDCPGVKWKDSFATMGRSIRWLGKYHERPPS